MKRIVMWLMVAALMAALMAATAVPAFTCGEGAANSGLAKSDPRFGYNFVKAGIDILQE